MISRSPRFATFRVPLLAAIVAIVAIVVPIVALPHPLAAQQRLERSQAALEELGRTTSLQPIARFSERTGLVTFLRTRPGDEFPVAASGSLEQRSLGFLRQYGEAFGIDDPSELRLLDRNAATDPTGMEHARFQRTFAGIPITAAEVAVHLHDGNVIAVNARNLDLGAVETIPTVSARAARQRAVAQITRRLQDTGAFISALSAGPARLELFNRGLLDGSDVPTRLAWFVEVIGPGRREFVWIDARLGDVLLSFNQATHARNRIIWDANSFGPASIVRTEGEAATGDLDVDQAYDYSGDTYDYFFEEHGRDSYDDAGAALISVVDYCDSPFSCPMANAFWDGSAMFYGVGFTADDVAGHELTHAVTEYTAGLFYYMQSGALNESYSDIFGETIDLLNGSGTDSPSVRWEVGEDIPGFGAIRDMADPTVFGDPGKLSDSEFFCGDADNGGVHFNSGVPNHAFALMVDGGAYNSKTITGIGLEHAGKIQYRALSTYLLSTSSFADNYDALLQSCTDLIGIDGISAATCDQVEASLDAVEMNAPWPCIFFSDGFESGDTSAWPTTRQ